MQLSYMQFEHSFNNCPWKALRMLFKSTLIKDSGMLKLQCNTEQTTHEGPSVERLCSPNLPAAAVSSPGEIGSCIGCHRCEHLEQRKAALCLLWPQYIRVAVPTQTPTPCLFLHQLVTKREPAEAAEPFTSWTIRGKGEEGENCVEWVSRGSHREGLMENPERVHGRNWSHYVQLQEAWTMDRIMVQWGNRGIISNLELWVWVHVEVI